MIKVQEWTGKPIGKPGIYSNLPIEVYHSANAAIGPSISSSGLRTIFKESPKHYWAKSPLNPERIDNDGEESEALALGRAAHHLLFTQADFHKQFAVQPATLGGEKWHGGRTVCKVWKEDRRKEGRSIITAEQYSRIEKMAESLAADPAVQAGCLNGNIEHSYFWRDKETGVWLKARPDANPTADLSFVDLKTTRTTDWSSIQKSIYERGYFMQAAMVAMACEAIYDRPMDSFSLLFVESLAPHDIEFVTLKDGDIVRGKKALQMALKQFAECYEMKVWPGRRGTRAEPKYLELSEWQQKDIEYRASHEA